MVSNNFINECKNRANSNRLGQIVVDGVENPITQSNNLQSFEIDSGCYVDGNIIGSVYAKCLKANFIADQNNLTDKSIEAQIGVKYADLSTEYINMGKYKVERPNNEITVNMSQITAYSDLYTNLDSKYICNIDYSIGDKTVSDLYIDVCNQLGLIPKTTTFINSTIPIKSNPFTNGEKNRTVLQTIGKISCSFIDIDNDTNKIDLCWLSQNEEPDYTFYKSDYGSVEGGKIIFGPINCLIIKNSSVDDENVTIRDEDSIAIYGEHSITISEDYILYDAELRQQAITSIWNRVKGMKYVDCKLTTYYGKPFLKLGDKIRIYISETEYFDTYVLKHNFTYDGAFTSIIESSALTEQEINTKQNINLGQALKNTQIKVNKQEGVITELVEETNENSNKIAQHQITLDTIEQQISGEYGMEREVLGTNQVFIDDALKYYPLDLTISGYSNTKGLIYPGIFYLGSGIYPLSYKEISLNQITICVDNQDRNNPTENLKEYPIIINEPLRSLGNIKDELNISISNDGEITGTITRYLKYTGSQIVKLDNPFIETFMPPKIELLEHSNYVYIKEQPNYQIYIKYLIYSTMNEFYATKVLLNTTIKQTEDSIMEEVSKKADDAEIKTLIETTAGNLEIELSRKTDNSKVITTINASPEDIKIETSKLDIDAIATFTNSKLADAGTTVINGSNITTGTISGDIINGGTITGTTIEGNKITGGTLSGTKIDVNNGKIGGYSIGDTKLSATVSKTYSFTSDDVTKVQQYLLGNLELTDTEKKLYDIDGNGFIDIFDLTLITKMVVSGNQTISGTISINSNSATEVFGITDSSGNIQNKIGIRGSFFKSLGANSGVITTLYSPNLYHHSNNSEPYIYSGNSSSGQIRSFEHMGTYLEVATDGTNKGINWWDSDRKLKTNIKVSSVNALEKIMQIRHREYDRTDRNEHSKLGYVAQELQEIDDSLVFSVEQNDGEKILNINQPALIPYLTKSIQEQQQQIEELKKEIEALKNEKK